MAPTRIAACVIASLVFAVAANSDRSDDAIISEMEESLAQDLVLDSMRNCSVSVNASKEVCLDSMRAARASMSSMPVGDIRDATLCNDVRMALARLVYDHMKGCMENATDNLTEQAMCRENSKDRVPPIMKQERLCVGKDWGKGDFMDKLREGAAVAAVIDVCERCTQDCDNKVHEEAAKAMGKEKDSLDQSKSSKIKEMATRQRLANAAKGCLGARRDLGAELATCADTGKLLTCGGGSRPNTTNSNTEEWKTRKDAAEALAKQTMTPCLDEVTPQLGRVCFVRMSSDMRDAMSELMKGQGADDAIVRRRVMQSWSEAAVKMVGDVYKECRGDAADDSTKKACDDELIITKAIAGFGSDDVEEVLLRYRVSMAGGGDLDEPWYLGGKTHDKRMIRKMGSIRAAAEAWTACKDAGEADGDCEGVAEEAFKGVAGTASMDGKSMREMKRLATAIMNGDTLILAWRPRLQVAAITDGTACVAAIEDKMVTKCEEASMASGSEGNATKWPCRLVDSVAEYGAYLAVDLDNNRTRMAMLAEEVAWWFQNKDLNARRLGQERRLTVVSEAFASQDAGECADTDQECIDGEGLAPTPSPTPSPSPQASADNAAGVAKLAAPVLALVLLELLL